MRLSFIKKICFLGLGILLSCQVMAQQDSVSSELSLEAFLEIVNENHPTAIQSELQLLKAKAQVTQARGGFDPKANMKWKEKYFSETQYYSLKDVYLKVPTWFGIEAKAGYEENDGYYLNPENSTSDAGLLYGGVSLPIGKGLFIDKRRAELRQAQIYEQSTAAERQIMLNDLIYEAGKAYLDWFLAYHTMLVYEEGVDLVAERLNAVKESVRYGDKPAIDTLEASIQLQNRRLSYEQAKLDYQNSSALLSIYMWADGVVPLEIDENTVPLSLDRFTPIPVDQNLYSQLDNLLNTHPQLRQYEFKIADLGVEQRLKRESLKPTVNLNYYALTKSTTEDFIGSYNMNNYKWGLDFEFPLFLRKERGALQLNTLKIREAELSLTQKSAQVVYKANTALNTWDNVYGQTQIYERTVRDYNQLVIGEKQKYNSGESSLFLVNYREVSYINARIKFIELLTKNYKAKLGAEYALALID